MHTGALFLPFFCAISLIGLVSKTLLRVLVIPVRSNTRPDVAEEQCRIIKENRTANAIIQLRSIIERAFEVPKKGYSFASSTTPKCLIEF